MKYFIIFKTYYHKYENGANVFFLQFSNQRIIYLQDICSQKDNFNRDFNLKEEIQP